MDQSIDFYFDFISPYGYFAAMQVEAVARRHNFKVRWHVFRLGVAVVKVMGLRPMMETPLKNVYVMRDVERLSTIYALPILSKTKIPDPVLLGSAFYAVKDAHPACVPAFSKALYAHIWQKGGSVTNADELAAIAYEAGVDPEWRVSTETLEVGRIRLKNATADAIKQGVFGSPTFVVGKEMIWGVDRLWMLEHYLQDYRGQDVVNIA
ncbi:2-hydroxychromene-2-carboxylate isomerase [Noviherbaspirillum sp. CPCC 100848]|uniref:2-hydroxychromene-2-carboxylate isomerase n=1 Tax=Noviherbaspirillum album TaxID=3080276 RepID=A0ABU6JJQ0_9BURK|nr:2-hydroxychromene-2-carboxylate isomerase [Noviherbaspirillum sp. CPCC 100848]MEC4723696.1 2-hydroxychromene-2-carboxylate isomerase [Noviherbaspirillum sp. CPCC 100848]